MAMRALTNPTFTKSIISTHFTSALQRQPLAAISRVRGRQSLQCRAAQAAGESSIPEKPSGLFDNLKNAYLKSLDERPVLTKALTSLIGFTIGDIVAQHFTGVNYDVFRTMRMSLFGLMVDGPLGHTFYKFIDTNVMPEAPKSNRAVLTKTAIDQLIYAPIGTVIFLTFLTLLEGRPTEIINVIQAKAGPVLLANYGLWPLVHLLNFRFVPPEQRILFNNSVSILWTTYLSLTCGSGAAGLGGGGSVEMLAASLPCATHITAVHGHTLAQAVRETVAVERLLAGWGKEALPDNAGAELLANYIATKSELLTKACGIAADEAKNYVKY